MTPPLPPRVENNQFQYSYKGGIGKSSSCRLKILKTFYPKNTVLYDCSALFIRGMSLLHTVLDYNNREYTYRSSFDSNY